MAQIKFYFDEMMPRVVAKHLVETGHDIVMAVDAGMTKKDDLSEHLVYAAQESRVMVTFDRPFAGKASAQANHTGLICWTGVQDDFGGLIRALSEFAEAHSAEDVISQVFWLKPGKS